MSGETRSLGVEAVQLLDAITDRLAAAQQRLGERSGGDEAPGADTEATGRNDGDEACAADRAATTATGPCPRCGHDPVNDQQSPNAQSCTSCPICAAQAMLRGERPEAMARLIDGALAVLHVLRGVVAGATRPAAGAAGETADGDASGNAERSDEEPAAGDRAVARDAEAPSSVVRIDIR